MIQVQLGYKALLELRVIKVNQELVKKVQSGHQVQKEIKGISEYRDQKEIQEL